MGVRKFQVLSQLNNANGCKYVVVYYGPCDVASDQSGSGTSYIGPDSCINTKDKTSVRIYGNINLTHGIGIFQVEKQCAIDLISINKFDNAYMTVESFFYI